MKQLLGKTITEIIGKKGDDEMILKTDDGRAFKFFHIQDCCECVGIEEIAGEMSDLIGSPITQADEEINQEDDSGESLTWTFYRLSTAKGQVVIRWLGTSNGYYSERVDFEEIKP